MLMHLFSDVPEGVAVVEGYHQPELVVLSVVISVVMSLLGLQTSHVARTATTRYYRRVALATGGMALGGGIWGMHFIGMLAFRLPGEVSYSLDLTLLSMVPAIVASWLALSLLSRQNNKLGSIIGGGVLFGSGVGLMHYVGMMAMRTPLYMHHDGLQSVLSVLAAIVLGTLALWIREGLSKTRLPSRSRFYLAGTVMGLAIVSMHYIAMHGASFYGEPGELSDGTWVSTLHLALALAAAILALGVMVTSLNGLVRMRELHRRANNAQSRLQAIVDTAVDAIITIDGLGNIKDFSRSAERLFGYSAAEVQGRNVNILMPEPYHSEHDDYLLRYRQTGETRVIGKGRELVGQRKDGTTFPIRLSVGKVELDNREPLFVGLLADISARIELEDSLREAACRAKQAARAKGQFLANMSHEIRTPMNSVIGFTELLLQGPLDATQRSHLHNIRQSSKSLLRLINDILDTTKLESVKMELESRDFSLRSVAMQVESALRISAQEKGLDFITDYPGQMPDYFVGDELRVVQILTNLVGNAIKFTERGRVELIFRQRDEGVRISVRDTGIGMTAEQVAAVFEPFTQADASISRRFGGTGLGTTIALQLVEAMKGKIEVSSQPGEGSEFQVWLPLPPGRKPDGPDEDERIDLPPLKILIADDVEQNLNLLSLHLEGAGHQVVQAGNGAQALACYKAGEFDLLLLDVHMPVMDGLQAAAHIRNKEKALGCTPVPIIALTASVMQEDREAALRAGMDGFASKPLNVRALFAEMARVLERQNGASGTAKKHAASSQLIDWEQGVRLWGTREQLQREIHTFVSRSASDYPLVFHQAETGQLPDITPLRLSVHGIRGASGNLGMRAVAELATQLETQLRQGDHDGLVEKLSRLQQLLLESAAEAGSAVSITGTTASGEAVRPDALRSSVPQLQEVLASHQLDDALLAKVLASLEQGPAAAIQLGAELRAAVENFDFEQAVTLLDSIDAAWPDVGSKA